MPEYPFIPRAHQFVSYQGAQCVVRSLDHQSGTVLLLTPSPDPETESYFCTVPLAEVSPFTDTTASHRAHGWSPDRPVAG